MTYVVDVWIERAEPKILVREKDSGIIRARLSGPEMASFQNRWGVSLQDIIEGNICAEMLKDNRCVVEDYSI